MKREPIFTPIDLQTWKRGQMFWYFSHMAPTGYSLTVHVDVTNMKAALEAQLSGGALGQEQLRAASTRYGALQEELDAAEMRWLELNEI